MQVAQRPNALKWSFWVCTMLSSSIALTMVLKILYGVNRFRGVFLLSNLHFGMIGFFAFVSLKVTRRSCIPNGEEDHIWGLIFAAGVFTCAEIMLSNLSYRSCSLGFMCLMKSTTPVTTYLLSIHMGLEKFDTQIVAVLSCFIIGSVVGMSALEIYQPYGILCMIMSLLSSSLRWVTLQIFIHDPNVEPIQVMATVQPLAALLMMPVVGVYEWKTMDRTFGRFQEFYGLAKPAVDGHWSADKIVAITIVLALILTLASYNVLKMSSSATFSVIGQMKIVVTIGSGAIIFGETWGILSLCGLLFNCICFAVYARLRIRSADDLYAMVPSGPGGASVGPNDAGGETVFDLDDEEPIGKKQEDWDEEQEEDNQADERDPSENRRAKLPSQTAARLKPPPGSVTPVKEEDGVDSY